MKKVLVYTVIGAVLGVFCLTFLFVLASSPEFQREAGFGWGVFILFFVAPLSAALGAYYGAAFGLARLALAGGKTKKAGWISFGAGGVIVGFYVLLYLLTGLPSPAAMHHFSAATAEPTTHAQDVRDAISWCVPWVMAIPLLAWGCKLLLSSRTS